MQRSTDRIRTTHVGSLALGRAGVVSDGEQIKTGFFAYIGERLSGFEPRPGRDPLGSFQSPRTHPA